jgi:hypothetical protein
MRHGRCAHEAGIGIPPGRPVNRGEAIFALQSSQIQRINHLEAGRIEPREWRRYERPTGMGGPFGSKTFWSLGVMLHRRLHKSFVNSTKSSFTALVLAFPRDGFC